MNYTTDSAYCRLCAKLKPYDLLTYLQTGEEMCQKVVNNLLRFNIMIEFQHRILPNTVCLPCIRSLEQAFLFISEVEQAQALLSDFMLVQINTAENDSCEEYMDYEQPYETIKIVDKTDQNSCDSVEVNDDGINLSTECDVEVMSDGSDDVYYDYSVINRNTEDLEEKKHEKQPSDDIIEINDESDEEVAKDKLEKEQNNNTELQTFNIKVCSVEKINKKNICKARLKIMDEIVEKLKLKHKANNPEQLTPKVLANIENSETDENTIKKSDNNHKKSYDNNMMVNENIISNENHIQLSWEDYEWKCTFCKKTFQHVEELQQHSMQTHNFCNPYQCSDCTSVRINLRKFLRHIRAHRNDLQYSCYKCFKRFPSVHKARIHTKRVHENSKYVCFGCNTPFVSIEELKEHSQKYYNKRYPKNGEIERVCEDCGKRFRFLFQLLYHMEVQHKVEINSYHCGTCNASFLSDNELRQHQKSHTGPRMFTCDTCGKKFNYKTNLIPHMLTHKDALAYSCTVCSKKFRLEAHLKLHMRIHTGETPYTCEVCQRKFRNICNRNKHVRRCHGIELSHRRQRNKIHETVPHETPPDLGSCNKKVDETKLG